MRVLAVDVGTSRCKAALYNDQLETTKAVSLPTEGISCDGLVELSAITRLVYRIIALVMHEAQASDPPDAISVTAIYGHVFLNTDYQPIGNGLAWNHTAAQEYVQQVVHAYAEVGTDPRRPVGAEHLSPRLLWLQAEQPDFFGQIRWVIGIKDYLVWMLTEVLSTDYSQHDYAVFDEHVARRLVGARPPWYRHDLVGNSALLPTPHAAHRVVGNLSPSASSATGLPSGVSVACGTSDGSAAMYGAGVLSQNTIGAVTGSTDVLMAYVSQAAWDDYETSHTSPMAFGLSQNRAMVGDNCILVGGSSGTSGAAILWVDRLVGVGGTGTRKWTTVAPGSEGVFVAPGLSGERAPFFTGSAAQISQLNAHHDSAALSRAVREAVCYRFATIVAGILPLCKGDTTRVVAGGGQSEPNLDRLRATVLPCELARADDPQISLRGSAMFGLAALESSPQARDQTLLALSQAVAARATVVEPDSSNVPRYQQLRDEWVVKMREET